MPEQKKIPSSCKQCKAQLSRFDMEFYLDVCESTKQDPLQAADTGGILCRGCFHAALVEVIEDDEHPMHDNGKRLISKARRLHLGIKTVK